MNNAIVRDATPRLLDGAGRNGSSAGHEALTFRSEALRGVYAPVLEPLERVQARLEHLSGSQKPQLSPLFEHALANPGKLVRPAIGLLASRFHPNDGRDAETLGVAVELLHVASLVHDDTVDDSETRRGRATVSRRWGLDMALLLGDYLMATAANIVCDIGNFRVIRRFTTLVVDLSTGELHERGRCSQLAGDLRAVPRAHISEDRVPLLHGGRVGSHPERRLGCDNRCAERLRS